MINPNRTIQLVIGGLVNKAQTWQTYLEENHNWKATAVLLTGPMIVVSVLLSSLLAWVFSAYYLVPKQSELGQIALELIGAVIGLFIAAFVFSFLAGVFQGKHDFNKGLAAMSFAAIPAYIGSVLGALPLIGWLLALGLGILSLVYLYKIIPSYLEVPEDKRVLHFISAFIAMLAISLMLSVVFGLNTEKSNESTQLNPEFIGEAMKLLDR